MIELAKDNFLRMMADHPMVLVVFVRDPDEDREARLLAHSESDLGPWLWGRVNVISSPDIAAMFGISGALPVLMIMREQVVLYCEPIDAASGNATKSIIKRAAGLDMEAVRREIAEERMNHAALFERRVCPTARRLR